MANFDHPGMALGVKAHFWKLKPLVVGPPAPHL